jgi:hypothetical protein
MTFFSLIPIVIMLLIVILRLLHIKSKEQEQPPQRFLPNLNEEKTPNNYRNGRTRNYRGGGNDSSNDNSLARKYIDVKGGLALAITISSFLAALTYLANEDQFSFPSLILSATLLTLASI